MKTTSVLLLALAAIAIAGCSDDDPRTELVPVQVGTYEIPLNDLAGAYMYDVVPHDAPPRSRLISFTMPDEVHDFRALRLVASGSWEPGTMAVEYIFGPDDNPWVITDTLSFGIFMKLRLDSSKSSEEFLTATIFTDGVDFTVTGNISVCCDSDERVADLLLGATIEGELFCDVEVADNEQILEAASGILSDVRLEALDTTILEEQPVGFW